MLTPLQQNDSDEADQREGGGEDGLERALEGGALEAELKVIERRDECIPWEERSHPLEVKDDVGEVAAVSWGRGGGGDRVAALICARLL